MVEWWGRCRRRENLCTAFGKRGPVAQFLCLSLWMIVMIVASACQVDEERVPGFRQPEALRDLSGV